MSSKINSVGKLNLLMILSVLMFFAGVTICFFRPVSGLLLMATALFLCPPLYMLLHKKSKGRVQVWMNGSLAGAFFLVFLISFANPELLNIAVNGKALANNEVLTNSVDSFIQPSSSQVVLSSSSILSSALPDSSSSEAVSEQSSTLSVSSRTASSSPASSAVPVSSAAHVSSATPVSSEAVSSEPPKTVQATVTGTNSGEKLVSAKSINSDTVAWLNIPYTGVDFPVLQTTNNDFYLLHDLYKQYYVPGSIFMDYRDTFTESSVSKNLIIYGHNKDDETLFDLLLTYKRDKTLINKSPYVYITTDSGEKAYRIFATFYTDIQSEENPNGFYYIYPNPTEDQFNYVVSEAKAKSLYTIDCDVSYSDNIITLSTCAYRYKKADGHSYREDQRFLVMARELREDESTSDAIPEAVYNPNYQQPNFDPLIFYQ